MHYNKMWDLVLNEVGAFEFKEAVIFQAGDAIKKKDISILYQEVTTFNPDRPEDGVTEYSSEAVTEFARKTGIEKYVKGVLNIK